MTGETPSMSPVASRPAVVLLVATVVLLGACGGGGNVAADGDHAGHATQESVVAPVEGAPEVTVTAIDIDFQPQSLQLTAGEPLNVTVVNDGEALHDFTLEEAGIHVNVEPGDTKVTSVALDAPGEYEVVCTVPGHADAGMVIDVTVT